MRDVSGYRAEALTPPDSPTHAAANPADTAGPAVDGSERAKVVLKVRNMKGKEKPLKVFRDEPLSKIYDVYADKVAKCPRQDLKLRFGGDVIKDSDTPDSLDMDDEDLIDASW